VNGTTGGNGFAGINNITGILTRAADVGTSEVDALDTLSKAFVDLRSDFFVADLVFIHPGALGVVRRLRCAFCHPNVFAKSARASRRGEIISG
jgi:hypothetical protein